MTSIPETACDRTTVIDWWRQQCDQCSDRVAVVTEDQSWTYQDIDHLVNRFANQLHQLGCGKGSHVGLCVDRSAEAIAAMLGVMKIGAAFVPLDPEYPTDRLASMVEDAEIDVIIGHSRYETELGTPLWDARSSTGSWIDCESVMSGENLASETTREFLKTSPSEADLAYLMYTSGSTGRPKGVEISHRALVAYCIADIECYKLTADDRTLQFSTLCFDIAIEEIFPPLLSGGAVVIRPRGRSEHRNELSSLIKRFDITAVHLATAYWHSWVDLMVAAGDRVPASLRLVIATGEKVSVAHYRRWQSIADHEMLWCNAYGPTEATVTATVYVPDQAFNQDNSAGNMPIGKPLPGYSAFILDKDFNVLTAGETGELCIGGPALACGYHKRPELTQQAFINVQIDGREERLYRTGDLARWLPDGNIDFGGRFDHQIKLGSYRIEPGEIEVVIDEIEGVNESLVSYDEVDGKKFLVAYVSVGSGKDVSATYLANSLRQTLPAYMIPARYVMMESFPKTINGKIDRDSLPSPDQGDVPHDANHVPPRDSLEQRLADLWKEVLHLPEIGVHDDFFLLGGSSLLVTQVITRLTTDLSVDLPVRDFFANPTIATSARQIRKLISFDDDANAEANLSSELEDAMRIRARLPEVSPTFFPSGDYELFSVHYRPVNAQPIGAVVLAPSIGHEYTRAYRNLQQLAVQLCQVGFEVLRFDYAGTGNSDGDCSELNAKLMEQNLIDARDFLAKQTGINHVAVVGLRLGATVASQVSPGTFSQTVLWDPVESGEEFLDLVDQFHDQELQGLTRYNQVRVGDPGIDQAYGYRMSEAKRSSIAALDLRHCVEHDLVSTDDEIFWEDSRYNEAAFSSPSSFAAIERLLVSDLENRKDGASR
ncbi:Linear gramicidin synthase subunit D [Rubripirellula obstinata]|uniref:Linear gramicidin synthase subunit D n=1 Tax=Rubripirellula obstinata TaxID=406547 RepID=A0A5B1CRJ5_9BACT|nr:amino acid adenylation domain-containing protein [Rubripirellula obstinata]KAA1261874.1 Linear gramicidin synthase subunit D [Rubripirellula obstinata]